MPTVECWHLVKNGNLDSLFRQTKNAECVYVCMCDLLCPDAYAGIIQSSRDMSGKQVRLEIWFSSL